MRRRRLGRTGVEVGEVGLGGAWLLGRRATEADAHGIAIVHAALDSGVDFIDTAECYIGSRSETIIGEALRDLPRPVVLGTKVGHVPGEFDWSREAVIESCLSSLQRLGAPTVDLLHLHTPPEPELNLLVRPGGAIDGLRTLRDQGLVRWFGITGRDLGFLRRCVDTDVFDTLLVFQRWDLLEQSANKLFIEARNHDMGIIAASPLRLGLFGSARNELFTALDPADRAQVVELDRLFSSEPEGTTGAAIRFALSSPEVSVVLSGAATPLEIEQAVRASDQPRLSTHLIDEVFRLGGGRVRQID
jgi:aryl-alcohol dehydrogenase-like predicted oxidoreductase